MTKTPDSMIDALAHIVFGGVALTSAALDHATEGRDLTFTQWWAIVIVGESDDPHRVGEIARRMDATVQATSHLLRRLEGRRLISLTRDEDDRRATLARLTPEDLVSVPPSSPTAVSFSRNWHETWTPLLPPGRSFRSSPGASVHTVADATDRGPAVIAILAFEAALTACVTRVAATHADVVHPWVPRRHLRTMGRTPRRLSASGRGRAA